MFNSTIEILQVIAAYGRGGAGLTEVCKETGLSRYIVRKYLIKMVKDGLLIRSKHTHHLTLLGNNLVLAYEAAKEGFEVSVVKKSEWSYCYQRQLGI